MCETCFIRRKSESTESVADFVTTAGAVGNGTQDLRTRHAVSLLHQQFINPLTNPALPPANMKETSRSAPSPSSSWAGTPSASSSTKLLVSGKTFLRP